MPIEPNDIPTFVDRTAEFLITCPQATIVYWKGASALKLYAATWRLGDAEGNSTQDTTIPASTVTDREVATLIAEAGGMYSVAIPDQEHLEAVQSNVDEANKPEPEEEKYHLEFHIDITPVENAVGDYGFSFSLKGDDAFTVRDGLGFLQASIGRFRRLMEENDLMDARLSNDDDDAVGIPVNNQ